MQIQEQKEQVEAFKQFESQWNRTIIRVARELSDYFKKPVPENITSDNAALFLENLTSEQLQKHAGNSQFVVLSASSGTGKTAVGDVLREAGMPKLLRYTTRPPRHGERDGIDYHFVRRDEFQWLEEKGLLVYTKSTYDEFRGIGREEFQRMLDSKKVFYTEGDALAFSKIKENYPEFSSIRYLAAYLLPQDARSLMNQFEHKVSGMIGQEEVRLRLEGGVEYLSQSSQKIQKGIYDGFIVNVQPSDTANKIRQLVFA
jgi:guanylate kinase